METATVSNGFSFADPQGFQIFVHHWLPNPQIPQKAILIIAHGMAEHAGRYARLAAVLNKAGYLVFAPDHRGHGKTAKNQKELGYLGKDGFNAVVADLRQLHRIVGEKHPHLPVFLLGHSMGSFFAQKYISLYGAGLKGVLLSGTCGDRGLALYAGLLLAKFIQWVKGAQSPSSLLQKLSFAGYDKRIRPTRTAFDWLSRDAAEVDRYTADPLCGFFCSAGLFHDLYRGLLDIHRPANQRLIPRHLPIYIFGGDQDPVGSYTRTVRELLTTYTELGIADVSCRFYPGGRHEMLNEPNRDEVIADLIVWLDNHSVVW